MKPECTILLVEDNDDEVVLTRLALEKLGFDGPLPVVGSVAEARQYLEGTAPFDDRQKFPFPVVIISDLTLGISSGMELLEWCRGDTRFSDVPFILYSHSPDPDLPARAITKGASAVFEKSAKLATTLTQLREVLARLPDHCRPWLTPSP